MGFLVFIICGFSGGIVETLTALNTREIKNIAGPVVCILRNGIQSLTP